MRGSNIYLRAGTAARMADSGICVFISHRLADLATARSVGSYLTDVVGVDIYLSDQDEELQRAVRAGDHMRIVEYIERGLQVSSHVLGIISNSTKGSWWVPFEIGSGRRGGLVISQLLLEDVVELPSYLRIAHLLRDSDDLSKWVAELKRPTLWEKQAVQEAPPSLPRVAKYRSQYPRFVDER